MKVNVRQNRMETIIFRKEQLEKREGESLQEYLLGHVKKLLTSRIADTLMVLILHCCDKDVGLMSRTDICSWDRMHT